MTRAAQSEIDGLLKDIPSSQDRKAELAFLNIMTKLAHIGARARLVMPPHASVDIPESLSAAFNALPDTQAPSLPELLRDAEYVETVIEARARLDHTLGSYSARDICFRAETAAQLVGQACSFLSEFDRAHELFEAKKDANSYRLIISDEADLYPSPRYNQ